MKQHIGLVSFVVPDYDPAIDFFVDKLGFELVEDTQIESENKRWVVVKPTGCDGSALLLARATKSAQLEAIGNQTGGRVFLFLYTDDFWRDYQLYQSRGIEFVREPKTTEYGTVAVFEDFVGNQWDLIQPAD
ncbi:VOC family protein [Arenicella xantha]|uniref:Catechol 2,3-dioxygenase-like lactoylglutathione lyase family enzyme n=1 Tax=Arenicella xantha TaxID=644221 RepID=A0A395JFA8_9GAMM|nr:VOC family protein [Arenicella xantha]RBP48429.1 catechol 2,3-dioxygenase-like lactoylglutathione lyase family enzyme [Arenicella xantha]